MWNRNQPATSGAAPTPIDWGRCLAEHQSWLRSVILARTGEPQAVDEVWQEVSLAAVTPERRPAEHVLLFNAIDRGEDVVRWTHQIEELLPTSLATSRALLVEVLADDQQKPDLAKQIGDLLEQARQLQKSLEALDAAVKSQSAAPPAGK